MNKPLATQRQRVLYEAREIWKGGFVTFDTETTGLKDWDEIVQWSVCDQNGVVLGSGYVKPTVEISMDAQEIHGISQEEVANAPTFEQAWPQIRDLLKGQTVVIYNADFDIRLLWQSAEPYKIDMHKQLISEIKQSYCAMEAFARFYGEVNEYYGSYRWQRLTTAIAYLDIEVDGQAHDAAYDASATALVIKRLAEMADEELPQGWHPPVYVKCTGGCGGSQECAEPDDIWYCVSCGVKAGLYHYCPGCARHLTTPATGIACDDLCEVCLERLEQEKMLLTGQWHLCSTKYHAYKIVQSSDINELCADCQRQQEWNRKAEEHERERLARIERERKEAKKAAQARYREGKKERNAENQRRAEQGLPPLEKPQRPEPEQEFDDNGHHFTRGKGWDDKPIVTCSRCHQTWRRPPVARCLGLPTFQGWECKPADWHTRTQLGRLKLQADWSRPAGYVVTMKAAYPIYDQATCTPVKSNRKVAEQAV